MHRQHELKIGEPAGQLANGGAGGLQRSAEALPPVGGDQHQAAGRIERSQLRRTERCSSAAPSASSASITVLPVRCTSAAGTPSLSSAARAWAVGAKWIDASRVVSTRFISSGKRLIAVTGAESGFDVTGGNALEIGGERGGKAGHRVALHQQHVGANLPEQRRQPFQHPGGDFGRRLRGGHQVQVVIGLEAEDLQHLVQHGAMLGRHADDALETIRRVLQGLHHRRHLDGLRASPEDAENPDHRSSATARNRSAMVCMVTKRKPRSSTVAKTWRRIRSRTPS